MAERKPIESWLTDMDGVLIHEGVPIPGADAFIGVLPSWIPPASPGFDVIRGRWSKGMPAGLRLRRLGCHRPFL